MDAPSVRSTASRPSRRTVATGLAWSVPGVAVVAAAPALATSLRIDPGINGWVVSTTANRGGCVRTLEVTSAPRNPGPTPDGAPYGLYLYDVSPKGRYSDAKLVLWVRGRHQTQNPITWRAGTGHSVKWSGPTVGTPQVKADGAVYTPYTWEYTGSIDPRDVRSDGRLYLEDFHVISGDFSQSEGGRCLPLDYFTYREIAVDPDGPTGAAPATTQRFERRNGDSGPFVPAGQRRAAAEPDAGVAPQAQSRNS